VVTTLRTRGRSRSVAAAALAAVLLAGAGSACSGLGADEPGLTAEPLGEASAEPEDDALARFYDQDVAWRECRSTMECAEVEVPLDYAQPSGETVTLALLRVPATDAGQRVGSMLVNPGGPGASGIEYAAAADTYFGDELRAAFDIVGFDPRGVGQSTPVDCLSDEELDEFIASDPDPDDAAEAEEGLAQLERFGRGCLDRSGDLAAHVSTEEAARDMDVLRAVLDQDQMVYFGASYGTFLGATYADLFPERVGRLVLDGAIDPSMGSTERSLVQAEGFEVALRAYVEHCVDQRGRCFLGESVEEGLETIRVFLEGLDEEPIPGDEGRDLTQGLAVLGVWAPLYNESYWTLLDQGLERALSGDGRVLLSFADQYVGRGPNGYVDNSTEALYAVNCLDDGEALTVEEAAAVEDDFVAASPTFGRIFAYGLTACGSWPVESGRGPSELTAPGADPILVIGTSRDPATPLAWAEALAEQLESGVLVRRDGDGHTGYGAGNSCVDEAVERYLVSGEVPEGDLDC
jgi:pimeloyl-ACP methyl ester carboxylesterase